MHRIQSTETGELGGWIESEKKPFPNMERPGLMKTLVVAGNARIGENAQIFGNAFIFDEALVYGERIRFWERTGLWSCSGF